ncbi:MAG: methyltransferase domain-containing protein [Alphaproteobacteria bacterium]
MTAFKDSNLDWDKAPAHWVMAKMGKTVLRPGGLEATDWLINHAQIENKDIVEIAPGLGITACKLIGHKPKSYHAVDKEEMAAQTSMQRIEALNFKEASIAVGDAQSLPFEDASKDLIIGEAMLSMQPLNIKEKIFSEVYRVLRTGGQYCIHELILEPDDIDANEAASVAKDLSQNIKVPVQIHTLSDWRNILEKAGLKVTDYKVFPMHLLEPKRLIQDEGFCGTIKFVCNILSNKKARERIIPLRKTFKKHKANLYAIAITAEKI